MLFLVGLQGIDDCTRQIILYSELLKIMGEMREGQGKKSLHFLFTPFISSYKALTESNTPPLQEEYIHVTGLRGRHKPGSPFGPTWCRKKRRQEERVNAGDLAG